MTLASDNAFPSLLVTEGSAPASPAAGKQRVFIDSADHLLKVKNSSGTVSSVGGGSAGALVLLEQHTASSSASLDFTTFISSTYDTYQVIGTDLAPATNNVDLLCRIGTGGGPTYDSGANYEWAYNAYASNASDLKAAAGGATAGKIAAAISNNAAYGTVDFQFMIHQLQSTSHRKYTHGTGAWTNVTPAIVFSAGGFNWVTSGTAATAIQFLMSSGNIASGTIRIYGIAK